MASFRFIQWLVDWIEGQAYFAFEWDLGNRTKNFIKHGITIQQAETVFEQPEAIRVLGEQVSPSVKEPRMEFWDSRAIWSMCLFASRSEGLESVLSIFDG